MGTERAGGRRQLLAVGRPFDFSDRQFDGFVARRLRTVGRLSEHYDVSLLLLRQPGDDGEVHPALAARVIDELTLAGPAGSRPARMRRLLTSSAARARAHAHGDSVREIINARRPDVAVTFGPWLEREFSPVFAAISTVHFFEEELARMPDIAPQSHQARLLRRLEAQVDARREPGPVTTVVIAPSEVAPARRRFPDSEILWYPYLLDPADFPLASTPSGGDEVLVVGQFSEPRNAEGLRDVLVALARHPPAPTVSLISQSSVHRLLDSFLSSGQLRNDGFVPDLYDRYRRAQITLVPARRATGIKTTVLQAWAAGTPVVCFDPIAAAFGTLAQDALVASDSPAGVAAAVRSLMGDAARRTQLATAGRAVYQRHFDAHSQDRALLQRVAQVSALAAARRPAQR